MLLRPDAGRLPGRVMPAWVVLCFEWWVGVGAGRLGACLRVYSSLCHYVIGYV